MDNLYYGVKVGQKIHDGSESCQREQSAVGLFLSVSVVEPLFFSGFSTAFLIA